MQEANVRAAWGRIAHRKLSGSAVARSRSRSGRSRSVTHWLIISQGRRRVNGRADTTLPLSVVGKLRGYCGYWMPYFCLSWFTSCSGRS